MHTAKTFQSLVVGFQLLTFGAFDYSVFDVVVVVFAFDVAFAVGPLPPHWDDAVACRGVEFVHLLDLEVAAREGHQPKIQSCRPPSSAAVVAVVNAVVAVANILRQWKRNPWCIPCSKNEERAYSALPVGAIYLRRRFLFEWKNPTRHWKRRLLSFVLDC